MMKTNLGLIWLTCALLATLVAAEPARADGITKPQRAEYAKLLRERNRLHVQLERLDAKAADLILQGREAVVVHAEQVSVQDHLDLVELRLAMLAARHGLALPPPPGADPAEASGADRGADATSRKVEQAFDRGRQRALAAVREDGYRLLASLDFTAFLNG
jgi:hypothetical protein